MLGAEAALKSFLSQDDHDMGVSREREREGERERGREGERERERAVCSVVQLNADLGNSNFEIVYTEKLPEALVVSQLSLP